LFTKWFCKFLYRFEQVVDAVIVECLGQVFVVSRSKHDGARDRAGRKYIERKAIRKLDIHKDDIRLRIMAQPVYALQHAVAGSRYFEAIVNKQQLFHQVLYGGLFVLNDEHFHDFGLKFENGQFDRKKFKVVLNNNIPVGDQLIAVIQVIQSDFGSRRGIVFSFDGVSDHHVIG